MEEPPHDKPPSLTPRDGHAERLTVRERVLEAALALVDANAEDDRAYRAAWARLRLAAWDWLWPSIFRHLGFFVRHWVVLDGKGRKGPGAKKKR